MPMTTVSNLSGECDRTFEIEVIGSPHQARLRTSGYKVLVPFSSLSQTIRSIGQRGGKVAKVTMLTTSLSDFDFDDSPTASGLLVPFEPEVAPQPSTQPSIAVKENPPPKSHRHHSKSKKR
jgi:CpcD/allophycocyanin linker domain